MTSLKVEGNPQRTRSVNGLAIAFALLALVSALGLPITQPASAEPEDGFPPLLPLGSFADCAQRTQRPEYCSDLFLAISGLNTYWSGVLGRQLPATLQSYQPPRRVVYYTIPEKQEERACALDPGRLAECAPAFYDRAERLVILNETALVQLHSIGDFSPLVILAHEWGHHVQHLVGSQPSYTETRRPRYSIQLELEADCFAGLWAGYESRQLRHLEAGDIDEALAIAFAGGDPRTVHWTTPDAHGLPEQRVLAFKTGFSGRGPEDCTAWQNYAGQRVLRIGPYSLALSPGMTSYSFTPGEIVVLSRGTSTVVKLLPSSHEALNLVSAESLLAQYVGPASNGLGSMSQADRLGGMPDPFRAQASFALALRFESYHEGRTEHGILYAEQLKDRQGIVLVLRSSGVSWTADWSTIEGHLLELVRGLGTAN